MILTIWQACWRKFRHMARVIAFAQSATHAARPWQPELLRVAVVCGCALALILAKAPLPF